MNPVMAVQAGSSIIGGLMGLFADKKKNKRAAEQLKIDRDLANQQIDISKYIQGLSKELMAKGSTTVDPYGGSTGYDAATGTYRTTLGPRQQQLQDLSDREEAARLTLDQEIRRKGLGDFERLRGEAANEASATAGDMSNFRRGIGRVDPSALAASMRLNRQTAVNAGFDDAERAATTLQTRTGSSAISDALRRIAVDRVRAQAQIGDPEVEALQIGEGINQSRQSGMMDRYGELFNRGGAFYDAGHAPAPYASIADAKNSDAMKFDLSKFDIAQGGSGTAAAGLGGAAAGLRAGYATAEANRIHNPTGKFISSSGDLISQLIKGS